MSLNDELADATTARTIMLARYDADVRAQVMAILKEVERDILAALPGVVTQTRKDRLNKQLTDIRKTISEYYRQIDELTWQEYRDLVGVEATWQAASINQAAGFDLVTAMPTEATLAAIAKDTLIQGAPSAAWWKRQDGNLQFQFTNAVRTGMAQSESLGQITKRVRQVMDVSRRDAAALVRTSVAAIADESHSATLEANSDVIKGKVSVATLDGRTTQVCAAYDGAAYTLDNKPISPNKLPYLAVPRHWNCRSRYAPLTKSFAELGLDIEEFSPTTRASMDGQVPANTTFEEFMKRKGDDWSKKWLGPGRFDLWKSGKITLSDLIDATGRPLKLSELVD